uniref:ShKT domain-containing protein n=1 Tax=Heterorhabditis bacteriophora TaxID=37862 RepID=A0A1I7WQ22_HETBA
MLYYNFLLFGLLNVVSANYGCFNLFGAPCGCTCPACPSISTVADSSPVVIHQMGQMEQPMERVVLKPNIDRIYSSKSKKPKCTDRRCRRLEDEDVIFIELRRESHEIVGSFSHLSHISKMLEFMRYTLFHISNFPSHAIVSKLLIDQLPAVPRILIVSATHFHPTTLPKHQFSMFMASQNVVGHL